MVEHSHLLYFTYLVIFAIVVSNRDDSNKDDKKYVNSHLICCLEEKKTLNSLHNKNIEAHHTYLFFGFLFVCSI